MAMTIYYLSATGNSLRMAKLLAAQLGENEQVRLLPIPEALKNGELQPEGEVGFVLPLHFFALPLLAEEFLAQVDLSRATYIFGVVTAGFHYISDAFHELGNLVRSAGGRLQASFYIDMVSVYLPLSDLPSQAKTARRLQAADQRLQGVAGQIGRRQQVTAREYFAWPLRLLHRMVQRQPEKLDEKFLATAACQGCGLCARICPRNNIFLNAGVPVWTRRCTQCLACLHICPAQCIELGTQTKGRRRYHHPAVEVKELFPEE